MHLCGRQLLACAALVTRDQESARCCGRSLRAGVVEDYRSIRPPDHHRMPAGTAPAACRLQLGRFRPGTLPHRSRWIAAPGISWASGLLARLARSQSRSVRDHREVGLNLAKCSAPPGAVTILSVTNVVFAITGPGSARPRSAAAVPGSACGRRGQSWLSKHLGGSTKEALDPGVRTNPICSSRRRAWSSCECARVNTRTRRSAHGYRRIRPAVQP